MLVSIQRSRLQTHTCSVRGRSRSSKLLAMLFLVACPLFAQPGTTTTLPTVSAYALDKSKVTLPKDMTGAQNVLVLYFQPDQNGVAAAWVKGLAPVREAHHDLQTYVLPVYSKENLLYRWWIVASMGVGDNPSGDKHTTVPIFVDKRTFFKAVGVTNEKQPFVLLTDKAGHIEWKTQGDFEQWRVDQLSSELLSQPQSSTAH